MPAPLTRTCWCVSQVAKLNTTMIGTPLFAAPEVLSRRPYDLSADVWSFGCIVACVYSRSQWPYPGELLTGVNFAALTQAVSTSQICPSIPPRQSSPIAAIGCRCCQLEPSARPTFEDITEDLQADEAVYWAEQQLSPRGAVPGNAAISFLDPHDAWAALSQRFSA